MVQSTDVWAVLDDAVPCPDENVEVVDELMQSQDGKPQSHQVPRQVSHDTGVRHSDQRRRNRGFRRQFNEPGPPSSEATEKL